MDLTAVLILALAPGLFWLWFFYRKDKLEPEPRHLIIQTFFLGALVTIPVILVELPFGGPVLFQAAIVAPIVEEYAKYFVVRHTIYKNAEFNEQMDGIVYGATAALGFASAENVLYLLEPYLSSEISEVITTSVIRALISVPGHALFASMWGYALGLAKFAAPERRRGLIRNGLFLAMALHGCFNAVLSIAPWAALGIVILVPVMWRMTNRRITQAIAASPHAQLPRRDRQDQ